MIKSLLHYLDVASRWAGKAAALLLVYFGWHVMTSSHGFSSLVFLPIGGVLQVLLWRAKALWVRVVALLFVVPIAAQIVHAWLLRTL